MAPYCFSPSVFDAASVASARSRSRFSRCSFLPRVFGGDLVAALRLFDQAALHRFRQLAESVKLVRGIERGAGNVNEAGDLGRPLDLALHRALGATGLARGVRREADVRFAILANLSAGLPSRAKLCFRMKSLVDFFSLGDVQRPFGGAEIGADEIFIDFDQQRLIGVNAAEDDRRNCFPAELLDGGEAMGTGAEDEAAAGSRRHADRLDHADFRDGFGDLLDHLGAQRAHALRRDDDVAGANRLHYRCCGFSVRADLPPKLIRRAGVARTVRCGGPPSFPGRHSRGRPDVGVAGDGDSIAFQRANWQPGEPLLHFSADPGALSADDARTRERAVAHHRPDGRISNTNDS